MMNIDVVRKIVQEVLREFDSKCLTERGDTDETGQGWVVRLWVNGLGREVGYTERDVTPGKFKADLLQAIKKQLPEWMKLVK